MPASAHSLACCGLIATTMSELNHMFHDPGEVIESRDAASAAARGSVLTSSKWSRGLSTMAQVITLSSGA